MEKVPQLQDDAMAASPSSTSKSPPDSLFQGSPPPPPTGTTTVPPYMGLPPLPPAKGPTPGMSPLSPTTWLTDLLASPLRSASRTASPSYLHLPPPTSADLGFSALSPLTALVKSVTGGGAEAGGGGGGTRGPFQSPRGIQPGGGGGMLDQPFALAEGNWFAEEEEEVGRQGGGGATAYKHPAMPPPLTTKTKKQNKKKAKKSSTAQQLFRGGDEGGSSQETQGGGKAMTMAEDFPDVAEPLVTPPSTQATETTKGGAGGYTPSRTGVPLPIGSPTLSITKSIMLYELLRGCISNFKNLQLPKGFAELVAKKAGCTVKQVQSKFWNIKGRNTDNKGQAVPFSTDISAYINLQVLRADIAELKADLARIKKEQGIGDSTPVATPKTTQRARTSATNSGATSVAASTVSRHQQQLRGGKYPAVSPFSSSVGDDMVAEGEDSPVVVKLALLPPPPSRADSKKKDKKRKTTSTPCPSEALPPMPTPQQLRKVAEETGLELQDVLAVCKKVREVMVEDWA